MYVFLRFVMQYFRKRKTNFIHISLLLPLGGSFGAVHLGQIDGDHPHHLDVGREKLGVISDGQLQVPVSYLFLLQGELKPTTQKHVYMRRFYM